MRRGGLRARALPALAAAALGAAAALLVACGSSGSGLIPAAQGGPLQGDIEAVEQAAESGDGNCTGTETALAKAKSDFDGLPATVDTGLRDQIRLGLENLQKVATETCAQPVAKTTTTPPKTTSTATTQTQSPTTTPTTSTTSSTPTPAPEPEEGAEEGASPGGGTPAPGEGQGPAPGVGSGGAGVEEGNGAGGLEGAK